MEISPRILREKDGVFRNIVNTEAVRIKRLTTGETVLTIERAQESLSIILDTEDCQHLKGLLG